MEAEGRVGWRGERWEVMGRSLTIFRVRITIFRVRSLMSGLFLPQFGLQNVRTECSLKRPRFEIQQGIIPVEKCNKAHQVRRSTSAKDVDV